MMVENQSGAGDDRDILGTIQPGMRVVDTTNREVGVVEYIHRGETALPDTGRRLEEDAKEGVAMVEQEDGGLFDAVEEAFLPVDELAEDMRARLAKTGFIRVQGDLLSGQDRYVGADRIHSVSGAFVKIESSLGPLTRR
jgi:hypothetical protein